jgi:hypothetical protein
MELFQFHHEQIVWLNQSRSQEPLFKNESLCLIVGKPTRTSTDNLCVDLITPKQILPALHSIRSSLLIWHGSQTLQRNTLRRIL